MNMEDNTYLIYFGYEKEYDYDYSPDYDQE